MNYSLQARALFVASLVLAGFLAATGLVLDKAFRDSAEAALRDRLHGYAETLQADLENHRPEALNDLPASLGDRLRQWNSGLYAVVRHGNGEIDWVSPSAQGILVPWPPLPQFWGGEMEVSRFPHGTPLYVYSLRVRYEKARNRRTPSYFLQIAETPDAYEGFFQERVQIVRQGLWRWFGAAALLLLLLQGVILRRSFAPLRQVAADLRAVEAGQAGRLGAHYPRELLGLTQNLNALLDNSEAHLTRYRDALGDLAHSLKTPLAILRGALHKPAEEDLAILRGALHKPAEEDLAILRGALHKPAEEDLAILRGALHRPTAEDLAVAREQIERMNFIVEYQLKRAAASGRSRLAPPVEVAEKVRQIVSALQKVHAAKRVSCRVEVAPGLAFHGDEGDLLEILGNLADNAFKWCAGRVEIHAGPSGGGLELRVEDDGPGIAPDAAARLLRRGERADPDRPGHGLGLAIVDDVVRAYGGSLALERSPLGGAAAMVRGLG